MNLRLLVLKILDGLFSLLGEILIFFGVYAFLSTRSLSLVFAGLFLLVLGQLAGLNSMRYDDPKKLKFFAMESLENIGRQFAYPLLFFIIYLMNKSVLLLALAFAFTLVSIVKSIVIFYKARIIEKAIK